ncbi:MAG: phosphotransferase family protein [Candidatus Heimdallarchaeota archaeon]
MIELSQEKIKQVLSDIFQTEKIENLLPLSNGCVNNLYCFQVKDQKFVIKILTRPPAEEAEFYRFEKEVYLLKLFKEKAETKGITENERLSVPVPEIIHLETNTERLGYKFYIMNYVKGKNLDEVWKQLNEEEKERLTKRLANILKDIHSITFDMFGSIEEFDCPRRFYSFESMIQSSVRRSTRKLGTTDMAPIELLTSSLKFIEENLGKINVDKTPRLVHSDFNPTNIILTKNEKNVWIISAIIDFEWSFAGNALADILNLDDDFIPEKKYRELFFETYFNEKKNLAEFSLLNRILQVEQELLSMAYGWINFHPTKNAIEYATGTIKKAIEK